MNVSDPIGDMVTRIRNAHMALHDVVELPHSRIKGELARILKREGFITDYVSEGGVKKTLRLYLKYDGMRQAAIRGIRRQSKPGRRSYVPATAIPNVLNGLGVVVLTTSRGMMTGREARKLNVGGEVLCTVW